MKSVDQLNQMLEQWTGSFGSFMRMLDTQGIPYISFSKLKSIEFCAHRYFMEFVQGLRPHPLPKYWKKGRVFHEMAARLYRARRRGETGQNKDFSRLIGQMRNEEDQRHLSNAAELLRAYMLSDWEILEVEKPFIIEIDRNLPPCIGVIDVVAKKDNWIAAIDHKTGRDFYPNDGLQLLLYRQYLEQQYQAYEHGLLFDEYRWARDNRRVRKPTFRRQEVRFRRDAWDTARRRLRLAYQRMERIRATQTTKATGPCNLCPMSHRCPKEAYRVSWDMNDRGKQRGPTPRLITWEVGPSHVTERAQEEPANVVQMGQRRGRS
jgi:hypothetical protein